jgi:hypothetical protein
VPLFVLVVVVFVVFVVPILVVMFLELDQEHFAPCHNPA